jgi:Putative sensor
MSDPVFDRPAGRFDPLPGPGLIARDFAYLALGLPIGIVSFTLAVTGLVLAAGLAITLLGLPVLLATLVGLRWIGGLERRRAGWVLDLPVRTPERRAAGSLWQRTRTIATDPASWRATAWSLVLLPVGVAGFTAAVTLWSIAVGFLTSPAWFWALPSGDDTIPLLDSTSAGYTALRVLIGVAMLPATAVAMRGLSAGTARLAREVLA